MRWQIYDGTQKKNETTMLPDEGLAPTRENTSVEGCRRVEEGYRLYFPERSSVESRRICGMR
jgi:hypothetical protein